MKTLPLATAGLLVTLSLPQAEPPGDDARAMAQALQGFASDLTGRLEHDRNWCWSPTSLGIAATLALLGAEGETADEIAAALHLVDERGQRWPQEWVRAALANLSRTLEASGGQAALTVINDVWGQEGYGFLDAYRAALEEAGSTFRLVDFASDPGAVRNTINDYIAERTRDRIRDLIPAGALTPATRQVLTNAVYFKGAWEEQFSERQTEDRPFHLMSGDQVDVPTMHLKKHFSYAENDRVQAVRLCYRGSRLAMVIVLPRDGQGIEAARAALAPAAWSRLTAQLEAQPVDLFLPRFEIRDTFAITPVLQQLGIEKAFAFGEADFSLVNGGSEPLAIDHVIHKTFIAVDESGTEAAAATAIFMVGAAANPKPPVVFRADRPFLSVIVDQRSGAPLFVTQVVDPR